MQIPSRVMFDRALRIYVFGLGFQKRLAWGFIGLTRQELPGFRAPLLVLRAKVP